MRIKTDGFLTAASLLEIFAIILPNPQWEPPSTSAAIVPVWNASSNMTIQSLTSIYQANISFSLENWSTVQTLSANTNPDGTSEIKGLLYVPTLSRSDPCTNITAPYIPHNVTRKTDFPSYQDAVPLVTVAPWVSIDCTQSYLAAGRRDGVRAAIFYQPGNSSAEPPAPGDSSWSLDDGGQWKETNQYPVYAIPSVMGGIVMQEL